MATRPLVSVLLPIYNGEKTLERTLQSLLDQTFQDFEILACIDGTYDSSEEILRKHQDGRIFILINSKNLGLGPTLNRLVSNSNPFSKYLAIAEQDDYYYPKRLELQVEFMEKNSDVGLVSGIAEFYNGQKVTALFPGLLAHGHQYPDGKEMFLTTYRKQIKVVNSCMMIRKSMHVENGLYFTQHHPSISVDWTYILRFSLVSKIRGLSEILVRLDRAPARNSVTSNKKKQFRAARELIRSFRYECPEIVRKEDYKYAMTTQRLLELGHTNYYQFIFNFLWGFLQDPFDKRWGNILIKKLKR